MFPRLSVLALLVFIGVVVGVVQPRLQDANSRSGGFPETQVPLQGSTQAEVSWVDLPFHANSLRPNFEPVGELRAVRSDTWTTLRHPLFSGYSVRIKQSHFCDSTVK